MTNAQKTAIEQLTAAHIEQMKNNPKPQGLYWAKGPASEPYTRIISLKDFVKK